MKNDIFYKISSSDVWKRIFRFKIKSETTNMFLETVLISQDGNIVFNKCLLSTCTPVPKHGYFEKMFLFPGRVNVW